MKKVSNMTKQTCKEWEMTANELRFCLGCTKYSKVIVALLAPLPMDGFK